MLSTFKELNKTLSNIKLNDKECESSMKTTIIANMLIHIDDKKVKEIFTKDTLDYITNILLPFGVEVRFIDIEPTKSQIKEIKKYLKKYYGDA